MKDVGKALKKGALAGFFGSLCCIGPLVLVLVGISGVSGAMALSGQWAQNLRWTVFIPLATLTLIAAIYFHIKKEAGVCNIKTIQEYKWFVVTTVFFALIVWILLLYVVAPFGFKLLQ